VRTVPVSELQAGMVLAKPLQDLAGRMLLTARTELTEKYIQRVRSWGFDEVTVEGEGDEEEPVPVVGDPVFGRPWDEIEADVRERFGKARASALVRALEDAVLAHLKGLVDRYA